jgi:Ras family protein A
MDLRDDPKTIQDLKRMNQRPVSYSEGQAVANKIKAEQYKECSAKLGQGVREVFQTATRCALQVKQTKSGKKKVCVVL